MFLKGMFTQSTDMRLCSRFIRDPASSTEEVNIRLFYESLQIAFPNNDENGLSPSGRERRGLQSSLAFKGTCRLAEVKVKRMLLNTTIEKLYVIML